LIYLLSKQAKKYLKSIQPRIAGKLIEAIEKLPAGKVKPIKGFCLDLELENTGLFF